MAEIKLVKLRTGEDVIAKITENQDGTVTLLDALQFLLAPTDDPKTPFRVRFEPAFPLAKDAAQVTIPKDAVLYALEPNDQLRSEHVRLTSGLVV